MSGRGISQKTRALIKAAADILSEVQPATVRGVAYRLFVLGAIENMSTRETQKVSRALVYARERGEIPWSWIVDETREPERISQWTDPVEYGEAVLRSYRKDFWQHQNTRVEVWSEKGTVRGVLALVLDEFAVTFRVQHGFGSATSVHDIAEATADVERPLIALYVGDWDPSGLFMSEIDLPRRLDQYGARVELRRIALTEQDLRDPDLPSFPADSRRKDPRHTWFRARYGNRCWELDALPATVLRQRVRTAIGALIDFDAWNHCASIEKAERESIVTVWSRAFCNRYQDTDRERRA
jgi:hypothetical protein